MRFSICRLNFSEARFIGIVYSELSRERTFENFYSEGGIYASQNVWQKFSEVRAMLN